MKEPDPISFSELEEGIRKAVAEVFTDKGDAPLVVHRPASLEPDWYNFFGRRCTLGGERGRLGKAKVYAINPGPNRDYEDGRKLRIHLFYPNRVLESLIP